VELYINILYTPYGFVLGLVFSSKETSVHGDEISGSIQVRNFSTSFVTTNFSTSRPQRISGLR
jgi:hypothetical protein